MIYTSFESYLIEKRSTGKITTTPTDFGNIELTVLDRNLEAITKYTFTITLNNPIPDDG